MLALKMLEFGAECASSEPIDLTGVEPYDKTTTAAVAKTRVCEHMFNHNEY